MDANVSEAPDTDGSMCTCHELSTVGLQKASNRPRTLWKGPKLVRLHSRLEKGLVRPY